MLRHLQLREGLQNSWILDALRDQSFGDEAWRRRPYEWAAALKEGGHTLGVEVGHHAVDECLLRTAFNVDGMVAKECRGLKESLDSVDYGFTLTQKGKLRVGFDGFLAAKHRRIAIDES